MFIYSIIYCYLSGVISSEAIGQSLYSRRYRIDFHYLMQPILLIVHGLSFQWHYFWICTSFSQFQPLILLFCLVMWHPWKSWLWLTVPLDDLLLGNTHVLSIQIPWWLIWLCLRFMMQVLVLLIRFSYVVRHMLHSKKNYRNLPIVFMINFPLIFCLQFNLSGFVVFLWNSIDNKTRSQL